MGQGLLGRGSLVANMSSKMGSITDNTSGGKRGAALLPLLPRPPL